MRKATIRRKGQNKKDIMDGHWKKIYAIQLSYYRQSTNSKTSLFDGPKKSFGKSLQFSLTGPLNSAGAIIKK